VSGQRPSPADQVLGPGAPGHVRCVLPGHVTQQHRANQPGGEARLPGGSI